MFPKRKLEQDDEGCTFFMCMLSYMSGWDLCTCFHPSESNSVTTLALRVRDDLVCKVFCDIVVWISAASTKQDKFFWPHVNCAKDSIHTPANNSCNYKVNMKCKAGLHFVLLASGCVCTPTVLAKGKLIYQTDNQPDNLQLCLLPG